ncbi:MAG TPA: AAA family ATPase [Elusimicrobiota bacterium]|nr:AAA family ATPase [Elusimicrobiota bacterium]
MSESASYRTHTCGELRPADAGRRVRAAVESCGLGDALDKPIGLLSKGFRQRVGLAAAILHDPEVLLLDEPTSGLDPNQAREVRELIARLKQDKAVLFSTHVLSEAEAACDRVVILSKGKIAAAGPPRELLRSGANARVRAALRRGALDARELEREAAALPGAASVRVEEAGDVLRLLVEGRGEAPDLCYAVFRLCARRDWPLLELGREEASLEAVFRELTAP